VAPVARLASDILVKAEKHIPLLRLRTHAPVDLTFSEKIVQSFHNRWRFQLYYCQSQNTVCHTSAQNWWSKRRVI
jgi:hypothetical protein